MLSKVIFVLLLATPGWSADLLGGACASGSPCTSVPLRTWTKLPGGGWPVGKVDYDKAVYSPVLKASCLVGVYHEPQKEPNQAIGCFSYQEQRWSVLHDWGAYQDTYGWSAGHTSGLLAYVDSLNSFWMVGGNSGSNMPTGRTNHTYLLDVAGGVSRDTYTGISGHPTPFSSGVGFGNAGRGRS